MRRKLTRMLGALGIVYGDIGTSPLYALHESFFGHHPLAPTPENILGVTSFFFWSLLLVVCVKYIALVMRADSRGEGGIFALLALINSARSRIGTFRMSAALGLIILGAALLLADGMITPAISVLSAVSGLKELAPGLQPYVVPVTVGILLGLFVIQPFGTHKIGSIFGPVMVLWFVTLIALGLPMIFQNPEVWAAINPWHMFYFMRHHTHETFFVLGSVVLCVTGGEALYADMGHFGRSPITRSWWCLVYPALLINYFGQAATLLSHGPEPIDNLFYSLVPAWGLVPVIVIATAATIIASQALISASFSLIQQAIALGVFPRQKIIHTNPDVEGQIYLPFVNWTLMVGCLALVIGFKSASALAAAYGIAVTGTMAITTIAFYVVTRYIWRWPRWLALPICLAMLTVDMTFFSSTMLKFLDGGYVPIIVAIVLFAIMHTWYWGRGFIARGYQGLQSATVRDLLTAKRREGAVLLDRSLVVLASRPVSADTDTIPPALQSRLDHLGAIYKHITILSVIQHPGVREIDPANRFLVHRIQDDPQLGSLTTVQIFYGYMQDPDLSHLLIELESNGVIQRGGGPSESSFTILSGAERLVTQKLPLLDRLRLALFRILLRNANGVLKYFNLEYHPDITTEVVTLGRLQPMRSWLREAAASSGPIKGGPVQPTPAPAGPTA